MKLKMVNGRTYCLPRVLGWEDVVTRGDVIEVDERTGNHLLKASFRDALNNEHFYFEEASEDARVTFKQVPRAEAPTTGPRTASTGRVEYDDDDDQDEPPEAQQAPEARSRRRRAVAG